MFHHWSDYRIYEAYAYKGEEEMAQVSLAYLVNNEVMRTSMRLRTFRGGK